MIDHFEENPIASTSSSITNLTQMTSRLSIKSTLTFIPHNGGFGGQLSHLCSLIGSYSALQNARIISAECHTESIALKIVHRFLILELMREGKKNIWIRLDRRRAKILGTLRFLRNHATTPANDTVSRHFLLYTDFHYHLIKSVSSRFIFQAN